MFTALGVILTLTDMVCETSFQCAVNQKLEMSLECLIIDIMMTFHKGKMVLTHCGWYLLEKIVFGTVYFFFLLTLIQ